MNQRARRRPLPFPAREDWRRTNTGRLLFNSTRRYAEGVVKIVNANGFPKIRIAHMAVPRNMDLSGTRITTLAARASMTKQSMADLVLQCERMGVVKRLPDPADQRAKRIMLTPKGRRLMEVIRGAVNAMDQEMRNEMGPVLFAQLRQALSIYHMRATAEDDVLRGTAD